jgi:hypothetical protein
VHQEPGPQPGRAPVFLGRTDGTPKLDRPCSGQRASKASATHLRQLKVNFAGPLALDGDPRAGDQPRFETFAPQ